MSTIAQFAAEVRRSCTGIHEGNVAYALGHFTALTDDEREFFGLVRRWYPHALYGWDPERRRVVLHGGVE